MGGHRAAAVLALAAGACFADPLLFVYFKEPANMGVFYAVSEDGYRWKTLNGGKPWMGIEHAGALIRDPFITRGPDRLFHMVWTWGWRGTSIGYATSQDLVTWSAQREIPLMARVAGTRNTWAPEIYWDSKKREWLVIWSSMIEGKMDGNRLWSARTRDFQTFTEPSVWFDPGYMVIDATLIRAGRKWVMVFKDERAEPLKKSLRVAESLSLDGPWANISDEFTAAWSEGPSIVKLGREYVVYYDHYRPPLRYEAKATRDFRTWRDVTEEMELPEKAKHGSFLRITRRERARLGE